MLKHSKLLYLLTVGAVIAVTPGCGPTSLLSKSCPDSEEIPCNPDPPFSGTSIAHSVNSDGTVIVGTSTSSEGKRGIYWKEKTHTKQPLNPEPPNTFSEAYDVNSDGTVVVGMSSVQGSRSMHAFRWKEGRTPRWKTSESSHNRSFATT